ncbi:MULTISPECIES: phage integrase N-terminal SAM-like domain-containing protein [unclassified Roseateles]|uniref:phage integrase N-terminal SAM-like domain-containing protein n=1 Tax=unclassified Roseateles TaxID=2626991 RepID=UPI0009E92900|nr:MULTISPECIES: phage integrase N-terminal SAM-like domain-containing protein [unclassified Roseateles]
MLDALQLRGMAPRTNETYVDAVSRLARHYHRIPELLSADEVKAHHLLGHHQHFHHGACIRC